MENLEVIVTGSFASGKTTFIDCVSERRVTSIDSTINRQDSSVSMNCDPIEIDGEFGFALFETLQSRRMSFDRLGSEKLMLGYVVTIDSAQPVTFREANMIIEMLLRDSPKPFVIAANKQDQPNAVHPDDLRLVLDIPP